jgi:hypothetical protein
MKNTDGYSHIIVSKRYQKINENDIILHVPIIMPGSLEFIGYLY